MSFPERGMRVLFLKGVALGLQLYGDAAARSGGDIDCLVESSTLPRRSNGWPRLVTSPRDIRSPRFETHGAPCPCSNIKSR